MPLEGRNDYIDCIRSSEQAKIKRGFSVNTKVNDLNLQEISLVSQRLVYDQIASSEIKLHEYPITNEMVKHCQQSHKRYQNY